MFSKGFTSPLYDFFFGQITHPDYPITLVDMLQPDEYMEMFLHCSPHVVPRGVDRFLKGKRVAIVKVVQALMFHYDLDHDELIEKFFKDDKDCQNVLEQWHEWSTNNSKQLYRQSKYLWDALHKKKLVPQLSFFRCLWDNTHSVQSLAEQMYNIYHLISLEKRVPFFVLIFKFSKVPRVKPDDDNEQTMIPEWKRPELTSRRKHKTKDADENYPLYLLWAKSTVAFLDYMEENYVYFIGGVLSNKRKADQECIFGPNDMMNYWMDWMKKKGDRYNLIVDYMNQKETHGARHKKVFRHFLFYYFYNSETIVCIKDSETVEHKRSRCVVFKQRPV